MTRLADALVIGGGFYGCEVALALKAAGFARVIVAEREAGLMQRASYVNQARVHNGYHYPRSLQTGLSSHANFARFCADYAYAVRRPSKKLYAIARDSRVGPGQFERFCREIRAPYRPLAPGQMALFDRTLIAAAYEVEEVAFDADALRLALERRLQAAEIDVRLSAPARIVRAGPHGVEIDLAGARAEAGYVFNCTYAALDEAGAPLAARVKRELAELALIEPPRALGGAGVTVMDGPFFSTMPFPAMRCFSLSHVRYTPHEAWIESRTAPVAASKSHAAAMQRDAARYMPCLVQARYLRSLFEIKAVLADTEQSDGRPILFERAASSDRIVSILGGKMDNIYDILALIAQGRWETQAELNTIA